MVFSVLLLKLQKMLLLWPVVNVLQPGLLWPSPLFIVFSIEIPKEIERATRATCPQTTCVIVFLRKPMGIDASEKHLSSALAAL